jgi:hypothetical protein
MSINRQDIIDFGRSGIKSWERQNSELLSCFDIGKLRSQMGTLAEMEPDLNPVRDLLNEAGFESLPESQQFRLVIRAIEQSFNTIFLTLFDRNALRLAVDEVTTEADQQLTKMREDIAAYEAEQREVQQVAAEVEAEPVEVAISAEDQCVSDWHAMGSAAFQQKYLRNQNLRPIYESVVATGRI